MDRYPTGRATQLRVLLDDGAGGDLDATAVTVTGTSRRTGAELFTDVAATQVGTSASWTVMLDGSEVALPDVVDLEWTATVGGSPTVRRDLVEFAGGVYADPVGIVRSAGTVDWPTAVRATSLVAGRIETATGWRWVPRWRTVRARTDRTGLLLLPDRPVRAVLSAATDDGEVLDVSGWDDPYGAVHTGRASTTMTVTWDAGEDAPPVDLVDAAEKAARSAARRLLTRDDRARAALGEGQFPFHEASLKHGRPFGIDGVDTVVMSHDRRVVLA